MSAARIRAAFFLRVLAFASLPACRPTCGGENAPAGAESPAEVGARTKREASAVTGARLRLSGLGLLEWH